MNKTLLLLSIILINPICLIASEYIAFERVPDTYVGRTLYRAKIECGYIWVYVDKNILFQPDGSCNKKND